MSHDIERDAREDREDAEKWRRRARWKSMESAPQNESTFLAAIKVNNIGTGKTYWEYALLHFSEGNFLFTDYADTGWGVDDYTVWMPLPDPPELDRAASMEPPIT